MSDRDKRRVFGFASEIEAPRVDDPRAGYGDAEAVEVTAVQGISIGAPRSRAAIYRGRL